MAKEPKIRLERTYVWLITVSFREPFSFFGKRLIRFTNFCKFTAEPKVNFAENNFFMGSQGKAAKIPQSINENKQFELQITELLSYVLAFIIFYKSQCHNC